MLRCFSEMAISIQETGRSSYLLDDYNGCKNMTFILNTEKVVLFRSLKLNDLKWQSLECLVEEQRWITTSLENRKLLLYNNHKTLDSGPIIDWKKLGERPKREDIFANFPSLNGYWVLWESFILDRDLFIWKWKGPDGKEERLETNRVNEVL